MSDPDFRTRNIGPRPSNHAATFTIDLHVARRPVPLAHVLAMRRVVQVTRNATLSVPFLATACGWHVVDLSIELEPHLIRGTE